MVSLFGYSDPNTRDVARLEKSVKKKTSRWASVFSFSKVEQHPNLIVICLLLKLYNNLENVSVPRCICRKYMNQYSS